jgi:hypothetical protein
MKETDEQLAKILSKGLEAATQSSNFIIDQAPDLIKQLITYKTIESAVFLLVSAIAMYFIGKIIYKDCKKAKYWEDANPAILFGGSILFIVLVICFYINLSHLIQLIFAPKIFLIQYASKLIK